MNFPNATVLNASSRSEFFGENARWKSIVEISIEGAIFGSNFSAIHGEINQLESSNFGSNAPFYSSITVNGISFGDGYVTNFESRPDDTDVSIKRYSATITISNDGNLNRLTSDDLGSINFSSFKYLENFSEDSSFTKGEGVTDSYVQNISFTVVPPQKNTGKSIAEGIVKSFFGNNQLTSLISGQYKKDSIKKYYEQSYDEVTNTYSATCRFSLKPRSSAPGNTDDLTVSTNVRVEYTSDGVINITEEGECIGNKSSDANARYSQAAAQVQTLISSAYARLSGKIPSADHNPLINQPINKSFVGVPFEGRSTYSITFTNSKEVIANKGYWSFNINIEQSEANEFTAIESGEITGIGELKAKDKYSKADTLWNEKKSSIKSRLSSFVQGASLFENSLSETHSEVDGTISYTYTYSTSNSLSTGQDGDNITKKIVRIKQDYDRKLFSTFNIVNKKEIAQIQANLLPNETSIEVVINGKYQQNPSVFLSEAESLAIANKPQNSYINNVSFSFSPSSRELSYSATYFVIPI